MSLKKPILIGCGAVLAFFVILMVMVSIWLFTGPEGGVKLSNDMEEYALKYLDDHGILDKSEELIAYYDVTMALDGTEAAILTTERVIYHKNGKSDSIDLTGIEDIRHREETLIGDVFEIFASSGKSMKIEIAPFNQGETFRAALMKAWEKAKGH